MGVTSKQRGIHLFPDTKSIPLVAETTISAADIVATGAGKLGHANGQSICPAPGVGFVNVFIRALLRYEFLTAAYTAGGNLTINWAAGGAALTGLVSAANSLGNAASKTIAFYPLSTAGVVLVTNVALHLVSSAAFTQPGTAAGVAYVTVFYHKLRGV